MQFGFDHEGKAGPGMVPCPGCGRFYIDAEQKECYHCFATSSGMEPCDQCVESGATRSVNPN
jgi:hypothetical protein